MKFVMNSFLGICIVSLSLELNLHQCAVMMTHPVIVIMVQHHLAMYPVWGHHTAMFTCYRGVLPPGGPLLAAGNPA